MADDKQTVFADRAEATKAAKKSDGTVEAVGVVFVVVPGDGEGAGQDAAKDDKSGGKS